MFTFVLILAGVIALSVLTVLAALVISVHVTDRRQSLRSPSYSRIDALARRVMGVYAERPAMSVRGEHGTNRYDHAGR